MATFRRYVGSSGDWVELEDNDGRVYFANLKTQERCWELPADVLEDDQRMAQQEQEQGGVEGAGDPGGGARDQWQRAVDEGTGEEYEVNVMTGETRWPTDTEHSESVVSQRDQPEQMTSGGQHQRRAEGAEQAGVGIFLHQLGGPGSDVSIKSFFEGFSAGSSELKIGDIVTAIDGVRVDGRSPSELRPFIIGPPGSYVTLNIVRGHESMAVSLLRGSAEFLAQIKQDGLNLHRQLYEVENELRKAQEMVRSSGNTGGTSGDHLAQIAALEQSLERERTLRRQSEHRESQMKDVRVQNAIGSSAGGGNSGAEIERLQGLLREEAARARRLQHELSSLSNADSVSQSELERRAHEAEERELQVVNLLEEERARWSDMLKNQESLRLSEQSRRVSAEEREQSMAKQLEDERFRWGEALRVEEARVRAEEQENAEQKVSQQQAHMEARVEEAVEEARRAGATLLNTAQEQARDAERRLYEAERRESELLADIERRNQGETQHREQLEELRRDWISERDRLDSNLAQLQSRLNTEEQRRISAQEAANEAMAELRAWREDGRARSVVEDELRRKLTSYRERLEAETRSRQQEEERRKAAEDRERRSVVRVAAAQDYAQTASAMQRSLDEPPNMHGRSISSTNGPPLSGVYNGATDTSSQFSTQSSNVVPSSKSSSPPAPAPARPVPGRAGSNDVKDLVALLGSGLPGTVRETVYALGLLAVEASGRAEVLQCQGALPGLVQLLASNDAATARFAALAVGNCAMEASGRKLLLDVPNAVSYLGKMLHSSDLEGARYASLAVGNLVLDASGRAAITSEQNTVRSLIFLLKSKDRQTLRYATGAVRNLAVDSQGRSAIISSVHGVESTLTALSSCDDASTARYATAALKNLRL